TGWFTYLKELGCVAAPLPFIPRGGGSCFARFGIKASEILDHRALMPQLDGRGVLVTPQYIANSSYSEALFGDIDRKPFLDLEGYFSQIVSAVEEASNTVVWAYWTELDAMAHSCGIDSDQVATHFQELDDGFARLQQQLAGTDAILVATADHGLIDTRQDRIVHLHQHPELEAMLRLPLCGEPRAAFCYLRPGAKSDFDRYIQEHLSHCLDLFDCDDIVDQGWFGRGAQAPRFRERIGDRLLLPKENWIVKDRLLQESPFDQIGVHGGLSAEELYVPLVIAEC
ncbi:MAG: alkaline phosphatase family protein, partial [Motiliproteus sp.]|nr:alkaline phosphatase family protein [Motiliproteus sp.]